MSKVKLTRSPEEIEAIEMIANQKPYSKTRAALVGAIGGCLAGALTNPNNRVGSGLAMGALSAGSGALMAHILNKKDERSKRDAIKQLIELKSKGYNELNVSKKDLKYLQNNKDVLTNTEMDILKQIQDTNK